MKTQGFGYLHYSSGNSANVERPVRGGLVLMGGGTDVDEAFQYLVERGGGGDVLVLRTSGADGYHDYLQQLAQPDSVDTLVFESRAASYCPQVIEKIDQAEVIFLAGGDQSEYLRFWRDTPVQEALQRAVERGVPLGGTSAGLAVMGDTIFTAHKDTITSEEALSDPCDERILLEPGWLSLPGVQQVLTDSHFSERQREGRLTAFLAHAPEGTRGLGVDERTALLVESDGSARVVGENQVTFFLPSGPPQVCEPGLPLTYQSVQLERFSPGQSLSMQNPQGDPARLDVEAGVLKISTP
jgi:cyanophycinase